MAKAKKKADRKLKPLQITCVSNGQKISTIEIPDPRVNAIRAINEMGKRFGIIAVPA